jgi:hypothetical protein
MKELLKYLVIRCTTRHAKTAIEVYNTLYPKQKEVKYIERPVISQVENSMTVSSVSTKPKKDEVLRVFELLESQRKLRPSKIKSLSTLLKWF